MRISAKIDQLHAKARENVWLLYFANFNRIVLAAGFIPSGMQKVLGERFTDLSVHHPMGNYLEAIYHTGFYYTFIGLIQVIAALLLLIPRTATIGGFIYFPIILNICILTFATRFDGSLVTAPLMVLANLYLLCWDYHKFKFVFPFNNSTANSSLPEKNDLTKKFPFKFFAGVLVVISITSLASINAFNIFPRNTIPDCQNQCKNKSDSKACLQFCDCIHKDGQYLELCLTEFNASSSSSSEDN